ncbi:DNA sulfur modification protein DndB [Acidithrix ferrooxidans]|uniref:DGQHR domain protein n=1 Tax=Acidithrix ferrooxidans TaxID=1280514 RepID=A0A0D8HI43_9ACTN|nr:DNA sulfur modification protein DndB [Acidithrix ferrooxidans]KJF17593.1 hypothetical protein AXFE_14930 [Acidithrix ferrooxidans]
MKTFPAIRAHMGRWTYYITKMSMTELAMHVKLSTGVYESRDISDALQRELNTSRAKGEILSYIQKHEDRFFNSLVIAAIGGEAEWFSVDVSQDEKFIMLKNDPSLKDFGILLFTGKEQYYALDGQHRLTAIKELLNPDSPEYRNAPDDFRNEEISVILVMPTIDEKGQETQERMAEFRQRFRRLFGHLNRYAKPMDNATNIIMDEDDVLAIITRRLLLESSIFAKTDDAVIGGINVDTTKGKNMKASSQYFTNIETFYDLNTTLISSKTRENLGWGSKNEKLKDYKRFRPEDNEIDELYNELVEIWSGMVKALPEISTQNPSNFRDHTAANEQSDSKKDTSFFWPIGQMVLARVVRELLDVIKADSVSEKLAYLSRLPWELTEFPWRNLILVQTANGEIDHTANASWKMRSEERTKALSAITNIMLQAVDFVVGSIDEKDCIDDIVKNYSTVAIPPNGSILNHDELRVDAELMLRKASE